MKKILIAILTIVCALTCVLPFTACGDSHTHSWAEEWSKDEAHHWHACMADGCSITDNAKKDGYAAHNYVNKVCVCGARDPSFPTHGLKFSLNYDNASYEVSGIGTATDTDIVIPSTYNGKPVTSVGDAAFYYNDSITSVTMPNGIRSLGQYAFYECTSLKNVTLPNSLTEVGCDVFSFCTSLTSIVIPNSLTYIGTTMFGNCVSLKSVTIPDSVTTIRSNAFSECTSLTNVNIPNSVTEIDMRSFEYVGIKSIKIPNSITSIKYGNFCCCPMLTKVIIPSSVTDIQFSFAYCDLLTEINFEGTKAQWKNALNKEHYTAPDMSDLTIICKDGKIPATEEKRPYA